MVVNNYNHPTLHILPAFFLVLFMNRLMGLKGKYDLNIAFSILNENNNNLVSLICDKMETKLL